MRSVRLRLIALALLPLIVLMPLLLGVTMLRWIAKFDQLLISKVESDLRIAEQYVQRLQAIQATEFAALAKSVAFSEAQARGPEAVSELLRQSQKELDLDFLNIRESDAVNLPEAEYKAMAAADTHASSAIALYSRQELASLDPDLAQRARLPLVATRAARKIGRTVETRGMVMLAAHPIDSGPQKQFMIGGRLLNQNIGFIDTVNKLVYRQGSGERSRKGTATLFLDDVRISTNVRLFEDVRALGTRVSEEVWTSVVQNGETWLDRAFVVNDWYISGYLPILDASGTRIGMLYVGFLESSYTALKQTTIFGLTFAFLIVVAISVPVFLRLAGGVFSPLEKMTQTMALVEAGDMHARIAPVTSRDEIGQVANHLNRLLDQIDERDQKLRDGSDRLNELVDQRTQELQEANRKLEATFAQLVMSEKLAAIGEITAGVAHEINNPVAIIDGNLEVIRNGLGQLQGEFKTELDLIEAQTFRITVIVNKLLQFMRPEEMTGLECDLDVVQVVRDALILVQPDLSKNGVNVELQLQATRNVRMVETELQQVLINLMINAAQSMAGKGTLFVSTRTVTADGVQGAEIRVRDTGAGIEKSRLPHVFDPFMTTKPGIGSGLGLSISQTLVTGAGGLIRVNSTVGDGAEFIVWLPGGDSMSTA